MRRATRLSGVALATAFAMFVVACGGNDGDAGSAADPDAPRSHAVDAAMLDHGQEIYTTTCAPCHGATGKGDGFASATLNPKPRDHTNAEYMDALSDQRIADTIRMGGAMSGYPNMPSSPHLRGDDLVALVAFVRTLGHGRDGVVEVVLKPEP